MSAGVGGGNVLSRNRVIVPIAHVQVQMIRNRARSRECNWNLRPHHSILLLFSSSTSPLHVRPPSLHSLPLSLPNTHTHHATSPPSPFVLLATFSPSPPPPLLSSLVIHMHSQLCLEASL